MRSPAKRAQYQAIPQSSMHATLNIKKALSNSASLSDFGPKWPALLELGGAVFAHSGTGNVFQGSARSMGYNKVCSCKQVGALRFG